MSNLAHLSAPQLIMPTTTLQLVIASCLKRGRRIFVTEPNCRYDFFTKPRIIEGTSYEQVAYSITKVIDNKPDKIFHLTNYTTHIGTDDLKHAAEELLKIVEANGGMYDIGYTTTIISVELSEFF